MLAIAYAHRYRKIFRARIEERVFVETDDDRVQKMYPDFHVYEHPSKASRESQAGLSPVAGGVAVAEPILVHVNREPLRQGYIEIVDAKSGNRVVTVIEFLSPTNKVPGDGQDLYLRKQKAVIAAGASLVEIDLTRSGKRVLAGPMDMLRPHERAHYMACITRGWKTDIAELYPLPLNDRLPAIRIPLRETDADVLLDLQALVDRAYENGSYEDVDYRQPPEPPLDAQTAAWVDEWLRAKGMR